MFALSATLAQKFCLLVITYYKKQTHAWNKNLYRLTRRK